MNSGAVRDRMSCGPRASRSTSHDRRRARGRRCAGFPSGSSASRGRRAFDAARLDDDVAACSMRLTVPTTELVAARQEVVQDLLALGVADLLQDDLLGGLRADAAELGTDSIGSSM